jgi:signal transduction histidine kinase
VNLAPIIFVLTIVTNVVIAAFVYANNPKHVTNRLFFAFSVTISVWLVAMLSTSIAELRPWYLALARSTLVLATLMDTLFFIFAKTVPDAAFGLRRKPAILLLLAAAAVIVISVTPLTFSGPRITDGMPEPIPGPGMAAFGLFQIAMCVGAISTLFVKINRASDERRQQLRLVLLGFLTMFGMIFGTIFVPVVLLGDPTFVTFAPLYVLLFTGLAGYAIFRRNLLNVKVVSAEMFSAALIFVTALQLFLSGSYLDFALRLVTFIVVGFVSLLFIRSVRDEVSQREKVQKLATDLEVTNKRLRQLDDLKTTMVSIASHQIRGPLGGIRGYLSMFRDGDLGPLTPKQQDIIAMNMNVLTRLINAVETFLDITKLESGHIMLRPELTDLDELIRGINREFDIPMQKRGLAFSYQPPAGVPVWVNIDPEKTKHVIFNLIDNALKYTEQGSVTVRLRVEDGKAICEVADTGMGVPPGDLERLFGKFERGELVVDRGGSGLGLYVVKMLTEMQGGKVSVSSPGVGKGTTFTVTLPLAKAL